MGGGGPEVLRRGLGNLQIQSENSRRLWLSKLPCWKGFLANFDAAGKLFPDFPAARNAIPTKVWELSGNKMAAGKSARLRERCWIFSSERATAFLSFF